MLLRKGKRGRVCLLPTLEVEAMGLQSLMANYRKKPLVTFGLIGSKCEGTLGLVMVVGTDGELILAENGLVGVDPLDTIGADEVALYYLKSNEGS